MQNSWWYAQRCELIFAEKRNRKSGLAWNEIPQHFKCWRAKEGIPLIIQNKDEISHYLRPPRANFETRSILAALKSLLNCTNGTQRRRNFSEINPINILRPLFNYTERADAWKADFGSAPDWRILTPVGHFNSFAGHNMSERISSPRTRSWSLFCPKWTRSGRDHGTLLR